MNDIVKSVTNARIEVEDVKVPTEKKECNKITVEFYNIDVKGWSFRVETASLKNYIQETGNYVVLNPIINPHIGRTNLETIEFIFEDDDILLINGAEFTITVRNTIRNQPEDYIFVLKDEKWIMKKE